MFPLRHFPGWTFALAALLVTPLGMSAPKRLKPLAQASPPNPIESETNGTPCPAFVTSKHAARIKNPSLVEASGLVVSRNDPSVFWSHNDSGNVPLLFAMTASGADLGTYTLKGANLVDWEDLAQGPGPDENSNYLYVADTGANVARKVVSIYRVEEPHVSLTQVALRRVLSGVTRFDFTYPEGKSYDAEALFVDPWTSNAYLVTKPRRGAPLVFRGAMTESTPKPYPLELVATLSILASDFIFPPLVTGASISADGRRILIRTYFHAYLWQRPLGESVERSLEREPCPVPLALERQGEAIAFSADGNRYFTTSEGRQPLLNAFEMTSD